MALLVLVLAFAPFLLWLLSTGVYMSNPLSRGAGLSGDEWPGLAWPGLDGADPASPVLVLQG
jgi:hypothetical protein